MINEKKEYIRNEILRRLKLLKNGLIANDEKNENLDIICNWIDNLDNDDIIRDIQEKVYEKEIPWGYPEQGVVRQYFDGIRKKIEGNKIKITSFFPKKTADEQFVEQFTEIKNLAEKELQSNCASEFNQYLLSKKLRSIYDKMLMNNLDIELAGHICKLGNHTDNLETLSEIKDLFDITANTEIAVCFRENKKVFMDSEPDEYSISRLLTEIYRLCDIYLNCDLEKTDNIIKKIF